ncbi:hypothetical protein WISP_36048 [Willisornis vidua]|uniref:STAR protein n=1 Tax=Willisornis vidua TaxID=1566151 RepID=A0ABQ9DJ98_9PASS|nr:hypothetical protein WISP_36048 [Willisornis vidua]
MPTWGLRTKWVVGKGEAQSLPGTRRNTMAVQPGKSCHALQEVDTWDIQSLAAASLERVVAAAEAMWDSSLVAEMENMLAQGGWGQVLDKISCDSERSELKGVPLPWTGAGPSFSQPSAMCFGQTLRRWQLAGNAVRSKGYLAMAAKATGREEWEALERLRQGPLGCWKALGVVVGVASTAGSQQELHLKRGPFQSLVHLSNNSTDIAKCHKMKLMKWLHVLLPANSPGSVIPLEQENIDPGTENVAISPAIDLFVPVKSHCTPLDLCSCIH